MLSDSNSAHSVPKYGRQYSLEQVHGPGPYSAPSPAYSSSSLYTSDAVTSSGPIIFDITNLAPTSPLTSPDTPFSPTAFIDSILQESEPTPAASNSAPVDTTGAHVPAPPPPSTPEKCLSVACLDKNELSDHLDAMDSNLDNLQTMLTSHGFSVDTSSLDIQELISPQEHPRPIEAKNSNPDSGKQLVHYTAQPLFLLDPDAMDTGNSELPVLFELGESSYFSEGDDYTDDPTISLLTGSELPQSQGSHCLLKVPGVVRMACG
ncbi:heat shock factor protein 1 isoform X6 [Sigmodon hispidus]